MNRLKEVRLSRNDKRLIFLIYLLHINQLK